eukprot:11283744-Heterocapsa_arctica.AAC.1
MVTDASGTSSYSLAGSWWTSWQEDLQSGRTLSLGGTPCGLRPQPISADGARANTLRTASAQGISIQDAVVRITGSHS